MISSEHIYHFHFGDFVHYVDKHHIIENVNVEYKMRSLSNTYFLQLIILGLISIYSVHREEL